jgi:choline-sulfatase
MRKAKNLLVIMSDEHQARAMSCTGRSIAKTPHLDALCARGTRFTNAYTPSPICVPARAAFASGRYVHDIRLWDNAMPYVGKPRGWGHALQDSGIRVESIGKLHYRYAEDPAGFDVEHIPMQVAGGTGMVWGSIRREDERIYKEGRMLGEYIGPGESSYTRYDTEVVSRTRQWLADASRQDGRWCLYVGLVAPHFPLIVPREFFDLYPLDSLPPIKLRPRDGYIHHPWINKQDAALAGDRAFRDENERLTAIACYYGLCSWMDHNVGLILEALEANGLGDDTTVIYTSDHGDNIGARGLWGKSNMYEESVAVPLIVAPPQATGNDMTAGKTCATPVSLLDLSETIIDHFDATLEGVRPGKSLCRIASEPADLERVIFSEYHAVGAVSGCYMVRKGRWKYIHYHGFAPELFDLEADPEETANLADNPDCKDVLGRMHGVLLSICDPDTVNDQAFADQEAMIESYGGREKAIRLGAPAATPPPV